MQLLIKSILAAILIGCIFNVPYGYFQLVRIGGCIGFAYLAYIEFEDKRNLTGFLCAIFAILLNPIYKIHFVRYTWNVIDLIIAGLLIIWIIVGLVQKSKI